MTTALRPAVAFDLPRGTLVGKYEILRKIAMGGMAEIYLARTRATAGFEKLVVLKRILPHLAGDPTFVRMFLDEARLAATLQHPHIADVYDVGESDGAYFFTMEFVHGQDIRSIRITARKRKEPIPSAIALAIVHGTASALDYAHEKKGSDGLPLNLVHRDVSASNVLVSYDGAVKLVDFGIARASGSSNTTRTGTLKGKIPYMSPEQAKGQPIDRRSDLFSLGVVLYELTVGHRPFRGESDFVILDQIVNHGAPAPSSLIASYPPELEAIVMKLLARDPRQRYPTAEAVIHDLEQFMEANRLWASARPIGKYMRTLFADRISAQEGADGSEPEPEYVDAITSQSKRSELITPPSAFPAVDESGDWLIAVAPDTGPIDRQSAPLRVDAGAMPAAPPPAAPVLMEPVPELAPKRGRLVAAAAVAVIAAGAFIAFAYVSSTRGTHSAPSPGVGEPAGGPAAALPTAPAAAPPTATAPPPAAPVATHEPAAPATAPPATAPPATTPPPPVAATPKPPPHPPVGHTPPAHPPAHPPVHPPPPAHGSDWDPNSPFLPGQ